jgi:hypothetical protein
MKTVKSRSKYKESERRKIKEGNQAERSDAKE